jgi:SAM-dependent methyltransferase
MRTTQQPLQSDYLTDVVYPDHFHREIMPVWLVSIMEALGRRAPDIREPYVWLDLGCGTGISTLVAAAMNPKGKFIGVDINADEISEARELAQRLGVKNLTFLQASFDQLLDDPQYRLPECDFIVTHGVYSWISADMRHAIHRTVKTLLRPGGIFYVSYITHPGAASFSAAQRMLLLVAQATTGSIEHKVEQGVDWLKRLAANGAGYFSEHVSAMREVSSLDSMDPSYLAHEFLNSEWQAFHVSDVIADMYAIDCDYAGSANPLENIDTLSIPGKMAPVMADMFRAGWDIAKMETARDIARNQNQRRDIYQKRSDHGNALSADQHRQVLLRQQAVLLPQAPSMDLLRVQAGNAQLTFETRIGPFSIAGEYVAPLLRALHGGAQTYESLSALPEYCRQPGLISQLLQALAWMGWTHFMRPDTVASLPIPGVLERLTQVLDERHQRNQAMPRYLPVPEIGSAIPQ